MENQMTTTDARTGTALPALTPEGERFALRQRQAKMFAMSPLVPEHLRKGTTEQAIANCWIALTLAEAMGEVPLIVMQNIHVVKGKAGFASQYMIARANSSGVFRGRIDWRIDRTDPKNLSVTAYAVIRETEQEVSVTCDMKMAEAESWTQNPKYKTMPEVMLRYRSAAFLVRFYAPDVMLGYQTAEEVEDVIAAATPAVPPLNARMLIEQAQTDTGDEGTGEPDPGDNDQRQVEPDNNVNDLAEHPAGAKADEILAEVKGCISTLDVTAVIARNQADIDAMPEEITASIHSAAEQRKKAIEAKRKGVTELQSEGVEA
jgi:hypothetical protein